MAGEGVWPLDKEFPRASPGGGAVKEKLNMHRVVTFLNREELEFLDKLERDMMFSNGTHISRSKIIEDIIDILSRTQMDASNIKDNQELEEKMMQAIAKKAMQ